ncbi:PIG-L deacetylase family protein [Persicitalea jodogahamensis]|uniref:PIG-L family deacetylase n=1 Tax=Persicitalea jodogahamensis TaxID=402147 RepID=A0A8J3D889_9BACT|nr:PIG-L family deacetylase [Persicitalea jodogahamensis]GHB67615.1 hypothetical protein GCM10007390_21150 [Persicitalea jodogahamensis]
MNKGSSQKIRKLTIENMGSPVLILAPHADDESLGCGGLIAALCAAEVPVHVWLISDGTMSHPNSIAYPAMKRQEVREAEFRQACVHLGVQEGMLHFFQLPDTRVPLPDTEDFDRTVSQVSALFQKLNPQTVFTPWRRDPHCDHKATTALIREVISQTRWTGTLYEYPIWLYELASEGDAPHPGEVQVSVFEVAENFLIKKKEAIECHASQLGQVIHDDPDAFCLQPHVLAHFLTPIEFYYRTHEK